MSELKPLDVVDDRTIEQIRDHHLLIGARVRILADGEMIGQRGTVYRHLSDRPAPWHVRPDSWSSDEAGIAYEASELEVIA